MFIPECNGMFFLTFMRSSEEKLGRQNNQKHSHVVYRKTQLLTGKVCGVMN